MRSRLVILLFEVDITVVSVELRGLAKAYSGRVIFRDVSAVVPEGHALAVTGANGAGKSTLLRMICGLLRPTRGDVVVTVGASAAPSAMRRHLGLVAPDVALYGELTGLENMLFFARVRGLTAERARAEKVLARLGLAGRGDDEARTYSSGMRHRLKYACALYHQPEILVLDEPSANLDEEGVAAIREVMAEQRRSGVLIFATNDPQEVSLADQVLPLTGSAQAGQR